MLSVLNLQYLLSQGLGRVTCVDKYEGFEHISLLTGYKPRTQEIASYTTRIFTGRRKHYYQVLEDFSIFVQCLLVEILSKPKQFFGCQIKGLEFYPTSSSFLCIKYSAWYVCLLYPGERVSMVAIQQAGSAGERYKCGETLSKGEQIDSYQLQHHVTRSFSKNVVLSKKKNWFVQTICQHFRTAHYKKRLLELPASEGGELSRFSETSVTLHHSTWRNNPEDTNRQDGCGNLNAPVFLYYSLRTASRNVSPRERKPIHVFENLMFCFHTERTNRMHYLLSIYFNN